MTSSRTRLHAATALLLLALGGAGCGGPGEPLHQDGLTIDSASVGDRFQVYVSLPPGYDGGDARYDTLYVLDANWTLSWAPALVRQLVEERQMEPVILVEVCAVEALQPGYDPDPQRERDLTPTFDPTYPGSGHAAEFAQFLRSELVPYVDATYRTNATREGRGLSGQSLGGLFTWYAVFTMSDVFARFVPASASIWYDDRAILAYEGAYAADHSDLPAEIYSTVSTGEGAEMVSDRDELVDRVRARGYPGLSLETRTYAGLAHVETSAPSYRDGWTALY